MSILPSRARPASFDAARRADPDYGLPATPGWREIDWRRHLQEKQIAGRRVSYVDIGEGPGPPVVFVHGLAGCWQNWLENIPRAAERRRVIALDLPGFGRSELPAEKISISGYARVVDELCERLELGPVAVVGNSMGGFIGAELAIGFPERADRLVLVAAAGISIASVRRQPLMTAARIDAVLAARAGARSRAVVSRPRLRHLTLSFVIRHPTRLRPDLLIEIMRGAGSPGFMPALDALTSYDFRDRLPEIGCPALIVWGEEDMLVPVRDASQFERLIPDSRKVVMADTGHVPMIERPRTFNDCLERFLAESEQEARGQAAA